MAVIRTFTCLCGVEKKSANHWILAEVTSDGISFRPWDWDLARRNDIIVLCGEHCAINLLSHSLGEWKNLPAELPPRFHGDMTESAADRTPSAGDDSLARSRR